MVTKCGYLYQYKTGNTIPSGWEKIWDGRGYSMCRPRVLLFPAGVDNAHAARTKKAALAASAMAACMISVV